MTTTAKQPKVGSALYIPPDDFCTGGLANVAHISEPEGPAKIIWVKFQGIPERKFNLILLLQDQEDLRKTYGDARAQSDLAVKTA